VRQGIKGLLALQFDGRPNRHSPLATRAFTKPLGPGGVRRGVAKRFFRLLKALTTIASKQRLRSFEQVTQRSVLGQFPGRFLAQAVLSRLVSRRSGMPAPLRPGPFVNFEVDLQLPGAAASVARPGSVDHLRQGIQPPDQAFRPPRGGLRCA